MGGLSGLLIVVIFLIVFGYVIKKLVHYSKSKTVANNSKYSPVIYVTRGVIFVSFLCFFFFYKCGRNNEENPSESSTTESTESSLNDDVNTESSTTCNICGSEFYGNGYEEQLDGSVKELSDEYQGYLCSPTCARKASQKLDDVAGKYGINLNESSSSRCQRCSGHYEEGFCNRCGGASPERVNQSLQNRANCEMCQGNKYVDGYDGVKVCPVCNGTGKESY